MERKKLLTLFCISTAASALFLVYGGIAVYYQTHFLPNTVINSIDCSNLSAGEAAGLLERQQKDYTLEVLGRNSENAVLGMVTAEDIQLCRTGTEKELSDILGEQEELLWAASFAGQKNFRNLPIKVTFDETLLKELLEGWTAFQEKDVQEPQDAYIGEYSGGIYEIIPETQGTRLKETDAVEKIKSAIYAGKTAVDLEKEGCYKTAAVTSEDRRLLEDCAKMNKWVSARITYDWNGNTVTVDGEQIQGWISREGKSPSLNEEAVLEFVSNAAKENDTYGKKRNFTTVQGVELTLPSGGFGWKTDREQETKELLALINQGAVTDREPVYIIKGAAKGKNDIGSSYVEIDLSNQHLYLFKEGEIVLESDFVSGNMSKSGYMTPPGVFGLTYKTRNAVLRGADYETPVNYWMPFNGNIGMHDASWRKSFGGDIYLKNGSHGCINLPPKKAAEIYEYVSAGFPVICYYD